jgi:hypothetical protein
VSSSLSRPPCRPRIAGGYFRWPQRDQVAALVRIAPHLRAVLTTHIALQFVNWSRLWPANDIQRDRLMGIAAEAANLKIEVSGIECVPHGRGGLCRALVPEHSLIPGLARQAVGNLAGFLCALCRRANGTAVDRLSRLGSHQAKDAIVTVARQAATACGLMLAVALHVR